MRRICSFFFLLLLVVMPSCSLLSGSFTLTGSSHEIEPARLAVISGREHAWARTLARKMTREFYAQSRFQVVSQGEIRGKLSPYPAKIKAPIRQTYTKTLADFSLTDKKVITEMAEKLDVEYIYIFWLAPNLTTINNSTNMLKVYHQFFRFPGCEEVGHGEYKMVWVSEGASYIGSAAESYEEAASLFGKKVTEVMVKKLSKLSDKNLKR